MQTQLNGDRTSLQGWERVQSLGDYDNLQSMASPEESSLLSTLIVITWESSDCFQEKPEIQGFIRRLLIFKGWHLIQVLVKQSTQGKKEREKERRKERERKKGKKGGRERKAERKREGERERKKRKERERMRGRERKGERKKEREGERERKEAKNDEGRN